MSYPPSPLTVVTRAPPASRTPSLPPLSVLFVINSLGSGGTERSTAVLLPYLRERGVRCTVACLLHRDEGEEDSVRADGFDVRVLRKESWAGRTGELRSLMRAIRPDVVHTAIFEADIAGRMAAAFTGIPVLTSLVNTPYAPERFDDPRITPWKLRVLQRIDAVTGRCASAAFHAVTQGVADDAVATLGIPVTRIAVVERGRAPEILGRRSDDRRAAARQGLEIEIGRPMTAATLVVLAVGRQEFQKDHVTMVEAMVHVVRGHPDALLVIAGREGNASSDLGRAIDRSGLGDRVALLGHRADVPELLVAADVFAMPSRYEGTAGAAIEALALETPIVATALTGTRGLLVDGHNARLVPVGDPVALADAIALVVDEPDRSAELVRTGRLAFEDRFTLDHSAFAMVSLYRAVVARGARLPAIGRRHAPRPGRVAPR